MHPSLRSIAFDTVDRTLRTSNGKVIVLPTTATALLGALIGEPGQVIEKTLSSRLSGLVSILYPPRWRASSRGCASTSQTLGAVRGDRHDGCRGHRLRWRWSHVWVARRRDRSDARIFCSG